MSTLSATREGGALVLGAFITTMNRAHVLKTTLERLFSQTRPPDHVLVIDNGNSSETRDVVSSFPASWVTYHGMSENLGPAGGAAYALDQLSRGRYDWIYWGDDDDPPASSDTIERLLKVAVSAPEDTAAVGAVGAAWDWNKGVIRRLPDSALKGIVNVDVIGGNQQLILKHDAVARVGLPDSRLFFGFEEPEYCLRMRLAGYRLIIDGDMMRECRERAGRMEWQSPGPKRLPQSRHVIWRRYYSTRNYIFAMRTFKRPDLARNEAIKALGRAVLSWRQGVRFGSTFTILQLRGIVDGYLGCMGRTVTPTPKYSAQSAQPDAGL